VCVDDSCEPCEVQGCIQKNCTSCCCVKSHIEWRRRRIHRGLQIEYLSVAWMLSRSREPSLLESLRQGFALIAFGSDSIIELASAFVVLRHLRLDDSGSSAQGEKTALSTTVLLFTIIPVIDIGSTYAYFVLKIHPQTSVIGIAIAPGSVIIMPILQCEKQDQYRDRLSPVVNRRDGIGGVLSDGDRTSRRSGRRVSFQSRLVGLRRSSS